MNKLFGLFLLALAFLAPVNVGQATLVLLPSPVIWPGNTNPLSSNPSAGTLVTVSAAGHYGSYILVAKESMVISHIGFRPGAATGSPTGTVSIEGVDATGFCDGASTYGGSPGTTATLTANTWALTALGGAATIAKGQTYCVKIAYASGTSFVVGQISGLGSPGYTTLPYIVTNTGTPTKSNISTAGVPVALGSNSTTFYQVPGLFPYSTFAGGTFNNGTAGAKRGMRFVIPMSARIIGIRWYTGGANGNYNTCVYDDAGSELNNSCTSIDGDHSSLNNNGVNTVYFDNAVTVTAGTAYRVAIEPSSATNANVSTIVVPTTDYRTATTSGTSSFYTTFTTAGGWVDTATDNVPFMDVILDQLDNGAGTGGGGRIIGG